MKQLGITGFFLLLGFSVTGLRAQDNTTLVIPKTVPYAKNINVRGKTKQECALDEQLAKDINRAAATIYGGVSHSKPKAGPYHVLEVEIIDVWGAGGGIWSGPKHMEIEGTLKDSGGKLLGSFTGRRHSMGGGLAGLRGTCAILKRCSRVLAEDLTIFLTDPTHNANLGE